MEETEELKVKEKDKRAKFEILLIVVCWLVYVTAQLGRHSYNSTKTLFMESFGLSHEAVGLPTTLFFFAYGGGQILVGLICGKYNKRIVVSVALAVAAAINFAVFFGIDFGFVKYLWLINGLAQANLWPVLLLTLSQNVGKKRMPLCAFLMSTASTGGTFLSYGISSLFAIDKSLFLYTFLISASLMLAGAILWFFTAAGIKSNKEVAAERAAETEEESEKETAAADSGKKRSLLYLLPLILMLACFVEFAAASDAIAGGITQWIPSILKENYGLEDSVSILMTIFIPLFSIPNAALSGWFYSKTKDFVVCSFILFSFGTLLLLAVIPTLGGSWAIVMILFVITKLTIGMVTNQMTVQAPLLLKGRVNSGFLAGLLNGSCYVGSAISTYVLGVLADNMGWNGTFVVLASIAGVSAAIALIFLVVTKVKKRGGTPKAA
ncbi:MAG TPA: hypothetical protein DDW54_03035 [Clostridiales bacterium]|nr:hypothetical protein [Clostridiales bacterium]